MNSPHHLAQLNIARARAPPDDPLLADFMAQLDAVNALAESAPGFVWRLKSDSGNATDIRAFDDPRMIVNMSVWESVDALFAFTYKTAHTKVMNRRKEWFEPLPGPHMVLWWVKAGRLPTLDEAMGRLQHLAKHGPTSIAFTFKVRFPAPVLYADAIRWPDAGMGDLPVAPTT
ncbi:MAG TPA: DUF3291 domain-containing protein [Methylomirabilota bacterium]|nr:DUF3291 domain-containing protein [Methylomirabilota bacterium]